jgi:hypothetical protein
VLWRLVDDEPLGIFVGRYLSDGKNTVSGGCLDMHLVGIFVSFATITEGTDAEH